jgi:hypothetical protein
MTRVRAPRQVLVAWPEPATLAEEVLLGLGRIVTLYYRSSNLYHIH